ncbi:hypothetical protein B0H19DRAFT_1270171 [Mycena capillaripes]|nr:hypothetical protein B0H19DRAFT_1270171 [Mycena capillaripes]
MPATKHGPSSFFSHANSFTINGGTFINARRNVHHISSKTLQRQVGPFSPTTLPIIRDEGVVPLKQLVCRGGYRLHAAQSDGRAVVVKVFSGSRAQEVRSPRSLLTETFKQQQPGLGDIDDRHPNFLRIMGRSCNTVPDLYLVYHGAAEFSAERMLASVLREGLSEVLVLGLTLVSGISSALIYLASKGLSLGKFNYTVGHLDFDLLVTHNGHLQICMNSDFARPWYDQFPSENLSYQWNR